MKYWLFIVISIFFIARVYGVKANGFGMTFDKVVGDYTVNVDYDASTGIYSGSPVQFAFQLFNKDRSKQLEFNDVWVSIIPVDKGQFTQPVFAGSIAGSTFPPSGVTFVFPSAGSYTLSLSYEKDNKTIAEATFPLDVQAGDIAVGQKSFFSFSSDVFKGALGVLALWLLVWIVRRIIQKKKTV